MEMTGRLYFNLLFSRQFWGRCSLQGVFEKFDFTSGRFGEIWTYTHINVRSIVRNHENKRLFFLKALQGAKQTEREVSFVFDNIDCPVLTLQPYSETKPPQNQQNTL